MKTKNLTFADYLCLIFSTSIIICFVYLLCLFLSKVENKMNVEKVEKIPERFEIVEKGSINYNNYFIFKDKKTEKEYLKFGYNTFVIELK